MINKITNDINLEKIKSTYEIVDAYKSYQRSMHKKFDANLYACCDVHDLFDMYMGLFDAYMVVKDQTHALTCAETIIKLFGRIEMRCKSNTLLDKKLGKYGDQYNEDYIARYREDKERVAIYLNQHSLCLSNNNNNNIDDNSGVEPPTEKLKNKRKYGKSKIELFAEKYTVADTENVYSNKKSGTHKKIKNG